jgi:hypothetical protein
MANRVLPLFLDRIISVLAYLLPLVEALYFFSARIFLYPGDENMKIFFLKYLQPVILLYTDNMYLCFMFTILAFTMCVNNAIPISGTKLRLTKFLRINVVQGILVEVFITAIGQIFVMCPGFIKNSVIGTFISGGCFFGIVMLVLYATFLIIIGRYPRIPIITESARLQTWAADNL